MAMVLATIYGHGAVVLTMSKFGHNGYAGNYNDGYHDIGCK